MAAGMLSGSAHSPPRQFMISTSAPASAETSAPDVFAACARLHETEQRSGSLKCMQCISAVTATSVPTAVAAQARLHVTVHFNVWADRRACVLRMFLLKQCILTANLCRNGKQKGLPDDVCIRAAHAAAAVVHHQRHAPAQVIWYHIRAPRTYPSCQNKLSG